MDSCLSSFIGLFGYCIVFFDTLVRFYLTFDDPQSKARASALSKKLNIEIFKKPSQQKIKDFSEDYFLTCAKNRLFLKKGVRYNSKPIFSDFDDWSKNYDDNLLRNSTRGLPKNFSCIDLTAGFGKDALKYLKLQIVNL